MQFLLILYYMDKQVTGVGHIFCFLVDQFIIFVFQWQQNIVIREIGSTLNCGPFLLIKLPFVLFNCPRSYQITHYLDNFFVLPSEINLRFDLQVKQGFNFSHVVCYLQRLMIRILNGSSDDPESTSFDLNVVVHQLWKVNPNLCFSSS